MSTQRNRGGRPAGRRNTRPTKAAVDAYYKMLANAADSGDTQAAGTLIDLYETHHNTTRKESAHE